MPASGKRSGIIKWTAIILVLLLAVVVAIPFVLDANQFRPQLESMISTALGRDVKLGELKLSIWSGSVRVDDISIADNPAFSRSPFVSAKSLRVSVEMKPLIFQKSLRINGITLERPSITLIGSESGKWNFSDLGSANSKHQPAATDKSAGLPGAGVSINRLEIVDGQVTIVHAGERRKPSIYNNVDVNVRDLSYSTSFPFTLTASLPAEGKLTLEGKAGPFNTEDMTMTPLEAEIDVKHFDLLASGFSGPGSGLAGVFDFSGTVSSDGKEVRSRGKASVDKLRVVDNGSPANRPVSLRYEMDYSLIQRAGNLRDIAVEIGKAIARLNGTYAIRESILDLKMAMRGTNMPVEDLTALFPAFGITLPKGASLRGGVLDANLAAEGPADKMIISGTVAIDRTRLTGFDLSQKMSALAAFAGLRPSQDTEIEKFASALKMSPDGIQASSLLLIVPAIGELSGNGRIAKDESLDFAMKAMLKPGGAAGSELTHLVRSGSLNVPFFVRGTASNPRFVPDMKGTAAGLLGSITAQSGKSTPSNTGDILQKSIRSLFNKKK